MSKAPTLVPVTEDARGGSTADHVVFVSYPTVRLVFLLEDGRTVELRGVVSDSSTVRGAVVERYGPIAGGPAYLTVGEDVELPLEGGR